MGPLLRFIGAAHGRGPVGRRVVGLSGAAILIGIVAAGVAHLLGASIALITNLAFYGELSFVDRSPAGNALGWAVVLVPVVGALIVGVMARYGSAAIRGHGIPEAMEQVLFNQSKIPARVLLLKPLSAVISIGTGGPFGAEGPIIATGGALGSLVGQYAKISADERKTLLAAGAAAGMSATFGAPVSAVLLAIELLLFEYRPRSLIPVILASVSAAGMRIAFEGTAPAFVVRELQAPSPSALAGYVMVGAVAGIAAVLITKAVYAVEDGFARLPIHWMWWPALGAIPVGVIGYFAPRTMGVGYDNIEQMVSGDLAGTALAVLCGCKLVSWLFSLGSGTSGGTLAPLFTIGGGLGAATAAGLAWLLPSAGMDVRVGALVGMAALFAGASRAPLASVVFAFEATRQPMGLLPLLGGCGAAYLLSCTLMKNSIMTEKIARRGRPIPSEYAADYLEQVLVRDVGLRDVDTLKASQSVVTVRNWLRSGVPATEHHGFPVVDETGHVLGVLTQRDIFAWALDSGRLEVLLSRPVVSIEPSASLRDAANVMLSEGIGRLPVIEGGKLLGIVTRSDLLEGHRHRLSATTRIERARRIKLYRRRAARTA
ncbi:MAG: chloride channel protein [Sandaracinaceae bacterium]|nr:chloride channel protein [Sandaracinaceae bacterium]MBK6812542.1 chloride channel protein [Sandaracinaceae bacterium]MBK7152895.1 chloride channel protein [Sandaracinaceae bacterium]MBK7777237.1 chloride channel protein [Sandaracinaceae bacterium]MBK8408072.1 chloride channel protein [Sandaracinaceae bacterium]